MLDFIPPDQFYAAISPKSRGNSVAEVCLSPAVSNHERHCERAGAKGAQQLDPWTVLLRVGVQIKPCQVTVERV